MKHKQNFLAFICLFVWLPQDAEGQKWAEKMFQVKKHDFGTVLAGAKTEYRFELQNLYEETVRISNVRSSCGCTSATIDNPTLKTWDKGAIVATFNTDRFRGNRSAVLTVEIDKPFRAEVQLQVSGNIRGDIMIEPGVVQFGEVKPGSSKARKIRVTKFGNYNWKIVDVRSKFTHVGVRLNLVHRGYDSVVYDLSIQTQDSIPVGVFRNELILVTNDRNGSKVPLTMSGEVMPALQISPKMLTLGVVRPGESTTKKVLLKCDQPFCITGIECENMKFSGQAPTGSKKLHFISIEFKGAENPQQISEQVMIKTDLNQEVVRLPVAVEVSGEGS